MKKCFIFLFSYLFLLNANAQTSSARPVEPETPTEFIKKLESYVTLSQQQQSVNVFKEFEKKFKSGGFNEAETARLMTVCNDMLSLHLNTIPYFTDFLSCTSSLESGVKDSRFEKWLTVFEPMVSEALQIRKFEPIRLFLNFSTSFIEQNALFYGNNTINWYAGNKDYVWKFEKGAPSVIWEKLNIKAISQNESLLHPIRATRCNSKSP